MLKPGLRHHTDSSCLPHRDTCLSRKNCWCSSCGKAPPLKRRLCFCLSLLLTQFPLGPCGSADKLNPWSDKRVTGPPEPNHNQFGLSVLTRTLEAMGNYCSFRSQERHENNEIKRYPISFIQTLWLSPQKKVMLTLVNTYCSHSYFNFFMVNSICLCYY